MKSIEDLLAQLDWRNPEALQAEAVKRLSCCPELDIANLIPGKGKRTFSNAVEIIKQIGYPKNITAIPGLLFLLQDINWPGALDGLQILFDMKKVDVQKPLEQALHQAFSDNDTWWITWLKPVVDQFRFTDTDFIDIDLKEVLSKSEEQ